jgi:hypothetical protein
MALRGHPERMKMPALSRVAGAQLHPEPGRRAMRGEFEGSSLKYLTLLGWGWSSARTMRSKGGNGILGLIFMGVPIERTCGEVQKLTGGMGGVPPRSFLFGWGRSSAERCAANAASARSASFSDQPSPGRGVAVFDKSS